METLHGGGFDSRKALEAMTPRFHGNSARIQTLLEMEDPLKNEETSCTLKRGMDGSSQVSCHGIPGTEKVQVKGASPRPEEVQKAVQNLGVKTNMQQASRIVNQALLGEWEQLVKREASNRKEREETTEKALYVEMLHVHRKLETEKVARLFSFKKLEEAFVPEMIEQRLNFCHLRHMMYYAKVRLEQRKSVEQIKLCKWVIAELEDIEIIGLLFEHMVSDRQTSLYFHPHEKDKIVKHIGNLFIVDFQTMVLKHKLENFFDRAKINFGFEAQKQGFTSAEMQRLCSREGEWTLQISTPKFLSTVAKLPLDFLKLYMAETQLLGVLIDDKPIEVFYEDFKCGLPFALKAQVDIMILLLNKQLGQTSPELKILAERQERQRPLVLNSMFHDKETLLRVRDFDLIQKNIFDAMSSIVCKRIIALPSSVFEQPGKRLPSFEDSKTLPSFEGIPSSSSSQGSKKSQKGSSTSSFSQPLVLVPTFQNSSKGGVKMNLSLKKQKKCNLTVEQLKKAIQKKGGKVSSKMKKNDLCLEAQNLGISIE